MLKNNLLINNFIEPIDKLMLINKINLPDELIYELKDYIFYNMTKMKFIKAICLKKAILNILIECACSRKSFYDASIFDGYPMVAESFNKVSEWTFGFPSWNYWSKETTVLRGSNCKKCGEYEYICIEKYKDVPSKIKLCNC